MQQYATIVPRVDPMTFYLIIHSYIGIIYISYFLECPGKHTIYYDIENNYPLSTVELSIITSQY